MEKTTGLSLAEAKKRLKQFGPNRIERKNNLSWQKLALEQFKSPLIYILFFAGLVTLFLKEWSDSLVIFLAVAVNVILGFIQEFKAEKSLMALKKFLVPQVKVVRDGQRKTIKSEDLVPGDIVFLGPGNKIPADGIVIEMADLYLNEAILTGESEALEKKKGSEVFMGTMVVSGRGKMMVKMTGMKTKMGKIAGRLQTTIEEQTPLKKQIGQLSKILALIFSAICIIVFFEGLWRGRSLLEMFTLATALAVASIPEGLVVSMTVILSLGMQRILKRKGLVRKLLAAETLGSVDVICADKTGTLTQGKMKVAAKQLAGQFEDEAIFRAAIWCNNRINPLEIAMREWALALVKENQEFVQNQRIEEIPFSSRRKFIAVLIKTSPGKGIIILSGAPEKIMMMSQMSSLDRKKWQKKLDQDTKKGLRVVAFSQKKGDLNQLKADFLRLKKELAANEKRTISSWQALNLDWLGLLLFEDPVRIEVKPALKAAKSAGIKIKVITGDYCQTANSILTKLEINNGRLKDNQIMEGKELGQLTEKELINRIDDIILFCRTTPEQKIRIVAALQKKGHCVAMMGDGVNDALALKKADIGIVVVEASEVAKETADMVLLDSNFKTIVSSVEEGRGIFSNIKKVILYLLSDSFTEVILIGGSLLFNLPAPVLAGQILWTNLIEDGLPGLALAFEPKDKNLMSEMPRSRKDPLLDKELKIIIFIIGIMTDFLLLGIFIFLLKTHWPLRTARTIIFTALAIDSLFYIWSCKTLRRNLWRENIFSNKFLIWSVLLSFLMLLAGIYLPIFNFILKTEPLHPLALVIILIFGLINVFGVELVKWFFLRKNK